MSSLTVPSTLPGPALLIAIVGYPLIAALVNSLFEQSLILPGRAFVELANFRDRLKD